MVQLLDDDIRSPEVRGWKGIHLFHFHGSSCSQKVRIFLNLKGVAWKPHPIDLPSNENLGEWYLGINPRGLVPALVFDGEVHIESNDIVTLIERRFPEPALIPKGREAEVDDLLRHEDDLHLDIRTLSFRFAQPRGRKMKSAEALSDYRSRGSGTVLGKADESKAREIAFWEWAGREGITDDAVRTSAAKFRSALDEIERRLASGPYLLGEALSVVDVAWFIYVNRLNRCGYPLRRLHPAVAGWFEALERRPEFADEVRMPAEIDRAVEENQRHQRAEGTTLVDVAGL